MIINHPGNIAVAKRNYRAELHSNTKRKSDRWRIHHFNLIHFSRFFRRVRRKKIVRSLVDDLLRRFESDLKMVQEGSAASASESEQRAIESRPLESGNDADSFFSPRFKSAAAMAGWDEEALLIASLVVDDTPEREFQQKKRSVLHRKSPTSGSRR